MLAVHTDRIRNRLGQLVDEVQRACDRGLDYYDRIREFKCFCDDTPALAQFLSQLPLVPFDFRVEWQDVPNRWRGGKESYAMRWDAIRQMVDGGPDAVDMAWLQLAPESERQGLQKITDLFAIPIYHLLIDQLQASSTMVYLLLRYKRWTEWFEVERLRQMYQASEGGGEDALDENLRRFLFESGIDYPFSQPVSPGGKRYHQILWKLLREVRILQLDEAGEQSPTTGGYAWAKGTRETAAQQGARRVQE